MKAALGSLVVGAALLVGCTDDDDDVMGPISGPTVTWVADIVGTSTYPISGAASVVIADDAQSFTATIEITGGVPGSTYPWHVHFGSCGEGGGIVGGDAYPALDVGPDGTAATNTIVLYALDVTAPYSVNVHLSPSDLPTIIGCGDLRTRAGTGGGGGGGTDDGGDY